MKINGAELLIQLLERFGVRYIAGIPGGANLPIYDALRNSSIKHILVRHEQAAGFIAQGISRSGRGPGVSLVTSGPGATNLLTALADAHLDSIPLVAITGQVASHLIGTQAFQEVDICTMANSIVKRGYRVRSAEELLRIVPEAFSLAMEGRRGPVLIDIPRDVQTERIEFTDDRFFVRDRLLTSPDGDHEVRGVAYPECHTFGKHPSRVLTEIVGAIAESQRPIVYYGGGIIHAEASRELREFLSHFRIPAVSTLMALGALEHDNEMLLGMLGMHGSVTANLAMEEADLIIAIGARFDDRATGVFEHFCPRARLIHIDIDSKPLHKGRVIDLPWRIDARAALRLLLENAPYTDRSLWLQRVEDIRSINDSGSESSGAVPEMVRMVAKYSSVDETIVTDVGQHQMWVAQSFPFQRGGSFLTSGGLGTMGFGLPAAIGAALASPERRVICFTGDGSIMMNIQELATLAELNLNVKIILLNNGHLGLVRQQQHLFFNQNYFASRFHHAADFVRIAEGFGIAAARFPHGAATDEMHAVLEIMMNARGPSLLEIEIDHHEKVLPMVPPGEANRVMILYSQV
jgi:acetolactate synthase-1/2/3 large subunit